MTKPFSRRELLARIRARLRSEPGRPDPDRPRLRFGDVDIDFENLKSDKGYSAFRTYGRSKLANVLFTNQLARQFEGTPHTANSLHPGLIATNLGRHMNPLIGLAFGLFGFWAMKTVPQGAATSCYLAANPDVEGVSGKYFSDSQLAKALPISNDESLAIRLWDESEKIIAGIAATQSI